MKPCVFPFRVKPVRAAPDGTLYAGTQPAGLFRSTDGGDNWTEIESFANAPEAVVADNRARVDVGDINMGVFLVQVHLVQV